MTVSLPDPMKEWVEQQVRGGAYASASDYMRDLIRRDRERRDTGSETYTAEALRALLAEARSGGASGITVAEVREAGLRIAAANGWLDDRG